MAVSFFFRADLPAADYSANPEGVHARRQPPEERDHQGEQKREQERALLRTHFQDLDTSRKGRAALSLSLFPFQLCVHVPGLPKKGSSLSAGNISACGRERLGARLAPSPPRPSFDPRLSRPELVAAESGESLPPGYMFALRPHVLNRPQIIERSVVCWTLPVSVVARPIRLPDDCPGSFRNFNWA